MNSNMDIMFSDPEEYAKNFVEDAALDKAQFEFQTDDNLEGILAMSTYNNLVAKNQEDTAKNIVQAGGANQPSILQEGQIKAKLTGVQGFVVKANRNINTGPAAWALYKDAIDKEVKAIKAEIGLIITKNIKTRSEPPALPVLEYTGDVEKDRDPHTNYLDPETDEWSPIKLFNEIAKENPYYGKDAQFSEDLRKIIGGKLDVDKLKDLFPTTYTAASKHINYNEIPSEIKNNIKIWTEYINSGFTRFESEISNYIDVMVYKLQVDIAKESNPDIIFDDFEKEIVGEYKRLAGLWRKEATECIARTLSRSNTLSVRSLGEGMANIKAGAEGKVRFIEQQIMNCLVRTSDSQISPSEVLNLCFNSIVHHRIWKGCTNVDLLMIMQRVIRRTLAYLDEDKTVAEKLEEELKHSRKPTIPEVVLTPAQKRAAAAKEKKEAAKAKGKGKGKKSATESEEEAAAEAEDLDMAGRRKAKNEAEAADPKKKKGIYTRSARSGGAASEAKNLTSALKNYDSWYEKILTESAFCKGENAQYLCNIMYCLSRAIRTELINFFGPLMETVNIVLCAILPGFPYIMEGIIGWNETSDFNRNRDHVQRLLTDIIMNSAPMPVDEEEQEPAASNAPSVAKPSTLPLTPPKDEYSRVIDIISSIMDDGGTVEKVLETVNPESIAEKISFEIEGKLKFSESTHGDSIPRFHVDTVLTVMILNNCLEKFLHFIENLVSIDLYFNIPENKTIPVHFKYHILKAICRGLVCLPNPKKEILSGELSANPEADAPKGLKWNERYWLKTFIINLKSSTQNSIIGFAKDGLSLIKIMDRILCLSLPPKTQVGFAAAKAAKAAAAKATVVSDPLGKTKYGEYLCDKLVEYGQFTKAEVNSAWKGPSLKETFSTPDNYIEWLTTIDPELGPLLAKDPAPPAPVVSSLAAAEKRLEAAVTPDGPIPVAAAQSSPVSAANPKATSETAASSPGESETAAKAEASEIFEEITAARQDIAEKIEKRKPHKKMDTHLTELIEKCEANPHCKALLAEAKGGFRRTIKRVYKTRINRNKKQSSTRKSKKYL